MSTKHSLPVIASDTAPHADFRALVEEEDRTEPVSDFPQSPGGSIYWRAITRAPRLVWTSWQHRQRHDVGPHSLTHTTTFRCNYHCKEICDSPLVHREMQKRPNGHDLSTAEVETIYRQLPPMDYVRFTGGEPTLRPDFIELSHLAETHLKPIVLHLTTNASHPDRVVRFVSERPRKVPLDLMISIDGLSEKHCASRHNARAFDHCIQTLEELAPQQKSLKLNLRINQTVADSEGIRQYRQLHQLLRRFQVRHQIVMAYKASATYAVQRDRNYAPSREELFTPVGDFDRKELEDFFDEVTRDAQTELKGPERWIQEYYLDGIRARMLKNQSQPNPTCVALSSHLRVFPNGDVPTCQFNSHIVGNLRLQSFQEIWKSEIRKRQLTWVRNCVGCWAGCEIQPSAFYSGDLLAHQLRHVGV